MRRTALVFGLVGLVGLSGCVSIPRGPNVVVYKGFDRTFVEYQRDDAYCKQYASQQLGTPEGDQELQSAATGALVAGVLGAGLGAAIGAVTGSPGFGAAIGGAAGVATGTGVGVNRGDRVAMTLQHRYDANYAICMDALQHRVVGSANYRP